MQSPKESKSTSQLSRTRGKTMTKLCHQQRYIQSNSYSNHDKFISVNNVLKEYNEMKEEIKNPENDVKYTM